jgi:hypothetical protein
MLALCQGEDKHRYQFMLSVGNKVPDCSENLGSSVLSSKGNKMGFKRDREEHRLRVFDNSVLRKIFGPKTDEVTGRWRNYIRGAS